MIEITCDKCGIKSDNPYTFNNQKFFYTDAKERKQGGYLTHTIHLCTSCKAKLDEVVIEAQSDFLGIHILGKLSSSAGIV